MPRRLPPRIALAGALAAAVACAWPAVAAADVVVRVEAGATPEIGVEPRTATNPHRLSIQGFESGAGTHDQGIRLQQLGLGDPAIKSGTPSCDTNPLFNDVVCHDRIGLDTGLQIGMGSGPDTLRFLPTQSGFTDCISGTRPRTPTLVLLGEGDDTLTVDDLNCGPASFHVVAGDSRPLDLDPALTVDAGPGNDTVSAGLQGDALGGGPGDDTLDGGGGGDNINGGTGVNALDGGSGDDTFAGLVDRNTIEGGPGTDTVVYNLASPTPVAVTIGNPSNQDGAVGINFDDVRSSVENVTSGPGPDAVIGSSRANAFFGLAGADLLEGLAGDDTLDGGPGNDTLQGGTDDDTLLGGDGDDVIRGQAGVDAIEAGPGDDQVDARDAVRDQRVLCGPGTDSATIDLIDPISLRRTDCERVDQFASDDGPPGHARGLVVVAHGVARVSIACPATARVACRGTLTVLAARGRRPRLGGARYAVRRGHRATVPVPLSGAAGARVIVTTRENGVSKKGPRDSLALLATRR